MKGWHYALTVFLGGCCFGMLSTFVKLAYAADFSVAQVVGSQFSFGLLFIWVAVIFSKRKKLNMKQVGKVMLAGVPTGLTGVFYYLSLQTLDASLAIIFLFQFIWIGTLLEWVIDKKIPSRKKLFSIGIILFGSILASGFISSAKMIPSWQGMTWGILAAFSFSAFIYASGAVGKELPPIQKSALLSTGGFAITFILFPPLFFFDTPVLLALAPYGLFLGLFGVALPPLLFSIGMPHVGPSLGTILSASELPVALIMSSLILSEMVTLLQWFGAVLILAGIIFSNRAFSKKLDPLKNPT